MIEINPFKSYCWSIVDILVDQWYKWLEKIIKQTVPQRTKHRCILPPWISKETSHLIKCLQTKRRRYKKSHPSAQSALLNVKNSAEEDKIKYESNLASSRSTAALFKYFQALKKSSLPATIKYDTKTAESDRDKAELFAEYFSPIYAMTSPFQEHNSWNTINFPQFETLVISVKEISEVCKKLQLNKAKGKDMLPSIFFRKLKDHLAHSLHQLFSKALQTCVYPSEWKKQLLYHYSKGAVNKSLRVTDRFRS